MSELGRGRPRPTNYVEICNTIANSYPHYDGPGGYGLAHGLQKDAIQNSVDAAKRKSKKSPPVVVEFRFLKTPKGEFFTITDRNTTGLTGDVRQEEDYMHLNKDDHWARFESFAFTKKDPDALGSRGQGKFIFLCASQEYKMFYDTIRDDDIYRLGGTQADTTSCPIYPGEGKWQNDLAREKLGEFCRLLPLDEVGTRVIICKPRQGFLQALEDGYFEQAIQETWFRLIEKGRLEVFINSKGKRNQVVVPEIYQFDEKRLGDKKSWIYGKDFKENEINVSGEVYKIKKFFAVLNDIPVSEDTQGIALVHNGMKITCVNEDDIMGRNIRERIHGYVEFDHKLDRELRKGRNQKPNHYGLQWKAKLPQAIREFVRIQLRNFGREKLGLSKDLSGERKRRMANAEKNAMQKLMQYMQKENLKYEPIKRGKSIPPIPPSDDRKIGLISKIIFPDINKKPRVDWGESLDLSLAYFNKTGDELDCRVLFQIRHGNSLIKTLYNNQSITIKSRSKTVQSIYSDYLSIEKNIYERAGVYRVIAILTNTKNGEELHKLTKRFWVEEDPPEHAHWPFELRPTAEMPGDNHKRLWLATGRMNYDAVLFYNTEHPEYLLANKDSKEDGESYNNYFAKIVHEGFLYFWLSRPADDTPDYRPLDTDAITADEPVKAYNEIMRHLAERSWDIYQGGD